MCLDLTDWKLSLPFPIVDCSQPMFVWQFLIYQIPLIIRLQYLLINSYSNVKKTVNCDDYLTWAFWKNLICFFAKLGKESHTVEFIGSIYWKLFKKSCNLHCNPQRGWWPHDNFRCRSYGVYLVVNVKQVSLVTLGFPKGEENLIHPLDLYTESSCFLNVSSSSWWRG